jgi:lysophospholipase L1-like esterase
MASWLALGDSYTIGEGVAREETYPFQTAFILRKQGIPISDPEIIAKTGWTTDELENAINHSNLKSEYDIVSLLIGVNNQYRGRSVTDYHADFERLLQRAVSFAGNQNRHVFALSIPDWGVTGFAEGRDRKKIAKDIDQFNAINSAVSRQLQANYLDITPLTREHPDLLVSDKLHPNGKMYGMWANLLAAQMKPALVIR